MVFSKECFGDRARVCFQRTAYKKSGSVTRTFHWALNLPGMAGTEYWAVENLNISISLLLLD